MFLQIRISVLRHCFVKISKRLPFHSKRLSIFISGFDERQPLSFFPPGLHTGDAFFDVFFLARFVQFFKF